MISVNWGQVQAEIGALVQRFAELPRFLAKKHIKAAIGRSLRPAIPKLRAVTPPLSTRRGRRAKGEKRKSTGELRRSIKVFTKYKGRNKDGFAYGVIGYRGGEQSLKALRLEFGRKHIAPRKFMERFYDSYKSQAQARLVVEMRQALMNAAKELNKPVKATQEALAGTYRRRS